MPAFLFRGFCSAAELPAVEVFCDFYRIFAMNIDGQWVGSLAGTNEGVVLLSIDSDRSDEAIAAIFEENRSEGSYGIGFDITSAGDGFTGVSSSIFVYDENFNRVSPSASLGARLPTKVSLCFELRDGMLHGDWSTDVETKGTLVLQRGWPRGERSTHVEKVNDWDGYKKWANNLRPRSGAPSIFRGQSDSSYELTSSFHRTGRVRLDRFHGEDMPELRGYVDSFANLHFDLNRSEDYGALVALAQHHGFPTPLLDWTDSPYVAAFFAFCDVLNEPRERRPECVRVYSLSGGYRKKYSIDRFAVNNPYPTVAPIRFPARSNPRILAQQGLFTVSNVADIEAYIRYREDVDGERYLNCVDIPAECAFDALSDLGYMGITHASLFPGLDGLCRALKHKFFQRDIGGC